MREPEVLSELAGCASLSCCRPEGAERACGRRVAVVLLLLQIQGGDPLDPPIACGGLPSPPLLQHQGRPPGPPKRLWRAASSLCLHLQGGDPLDPPAPAAGCSVVVRSAARSEEGLDDSAADDSPADDTLHMRESKDHGLTARFQVCNYAKGRTQRIDLIPH